MSQMELHLMHIKRDNYWNTKITLAPLSWKEQKRKKSLLQQIVDVLKGSKECSTSRQF